MCYYGCLYEDDQGICTQPISEPCNATVSKSAAIDQEWPVRQVEVKPKIHNLADIEQAMSGCRPGFA